MKKQFQILSIVIVIIFNSCGRYNAEIASTMTTGTKLPTNSSLPGNETDLLLMDHDGRLRFNAESGDGEKELLNLSVKRTSWTIVSYEAQDPAISSVSYSVN